MDCAGSALPCELVTYSLLVWQAAMILELACLHCITWVHISLTNSLQWLHKWSDRTLRVRIRLQTFCHTVCSTSKLIIISDISHSFASSPPIFVPRF